MPRPRLLQATIDAFSLPDLRRRILITFGILVVFRLVAHVPIPGVNPTALQEIFNQNALLGMFDMFSGGALRNFSIAAMGVYPYITATIIMQLMTPVIPRLQALAEEGEAGKNKMNLITHWITVPLAGLSGYGQLVLLQRQGAVAGTDALSTSAIILALIAGSLFLVWLGEQITEYGIGNGISIIIFAGIVAGLPEMVGRGFLAGGQGQLMGLAAFIIIGLATTVLIVLFTEAHRRIPVQYAKSVFRSGRMYRQSGATHIPLRVNTAGMIPLIFAMAIVIFPGIVASYFANPQGENPNLANYIQDMFNPSATLPLGLVYWVLFFLFVIAFTFFYTKVVFTQQDLPGVLQRQGGFIPGIRPGKQTADYLNSVINRITWGGALFLGFVAIMPFVAREITNVQVVQLSSFGMLIVVGVVLDTLKQMEAQLAMRRYEGFLK
jgi:preprotein translocase subunit SecY